MADLSREAVKNRANIDLNVNVSMLEELQIRGFNKDEVEKMFRVDEAHVRLGYQSIYKIMLSSCYETMTGTTDMRKYTEKDSNAKITNILFCVFSHVRSGTPAIVS